MTVYTKPAADVFAPTDANGAARGGNMGEVQVWGTEIEAAIEDAETTAAADVAASAAVLTAAIDAEEARALAAEASLDTRIDLLELGEQPKEAVRVATTANGTLATAFDNGSTVDGVTLATSDRILIKDQSAAEVNGIYIVAASGAPTRATDMDAGSEFPGATVFVREGSVNAGLTFKCANTAEPTVGSTAITFVLAGEQSSDLDGLRAATTIASAATTNLASVSGDAVTVTGTTTITAFGTVSAGAERTLIFAASLSITHNGTSLILLGGADRVTDAGGTMVLRSLGSGNWREISYHPGIGAELADAETRTFIYAGPGGDMCDLLAQSDDATGGSGTVIEDAVIRHLDNRMWAISAAMANMAVTGLTPFREGMNVVLGVGQSFMAASDNSARIQLTTWTGYQLDGLTYNARMIGTSDRCKSSGATYDYFGTLVLSPLQDTVVSGSTGAATVVSQADVEAGNYTTSARGASPLPCAIINFEKQWCSWIGKEVDLTRFDVAVNVAKGEAGIEDIGAGDSLSRMEDGITQADGACDVTEASVTTRQVGCVFERHGQYDEQYANTGSGVTPAEYKTLHRAYRADVLAQAASVFGQTLPPPWIGTQVSGTRGYEGSPIAMAQLEMSLNKGHGALDNDFFLACPDYPFPNFINAASPHPNAEDDHPTANGTYMPADYMAWARFTVQVLKKNWFLTHAKTAYFHGRYIFVGFVSMVPPLVVKDVCVGTTMTEITVGGVPTYGFTVDDSGEVDIVGVTLVGDNVFRIECDADLSAPVLGIAQGDKPNWPDKLGASNITDSQNLFTLFEKLFVDGYTDVYAGMYDDTLELEDITEILGKQDMGNWAAAQIISCVPMPADFIA